MRFAVKGTEGFVCSNCGATVITRWGVDPSAKAQPTAYVLCHPEGGHRPLPDSAS
ncbi:MAG: hypothetical protein ABC596_08835 [Candidatus Methanosuratincola petrocarbonis]